MVWVGGILKIIYSNPPVLGRETYTRPGERSNEWHWAELDQQVLSIRPHPPQRKIQC